MLTTTREVLVDVLDLDTVTRVRRADAGGRDVPPAHPDAQVGGHGVLGLESEDPADDRLGGGFPHSAGRGLRTGPQPADALVVKHGLRISLGQETAVWRMSASSAGADSIGQCPVDRSKRRHGAWLRNASIGTPASSRP